MSPAAKPASRSRRKKGEPHEVKVSGSTTQKVTVKVEPSEHVTVVWSCGTPRVFSVEGLRECIELIDEFGAPDLWLFPVDSSNRGFFVRVNDGQLTANNNVIDGDWVSWAQLKRALQATIAEIRSS